MPGTRPTPARRRLRRQRAVELTAAARARRQEQTRQLDPDGSLATFRGLVNHLSNWQRTRWAQAGYPGLSSQVADAVWPFTRMERPG